MVTRDHDTARASADEAALARALRLTRRGEVISYAELARRAGRPRGARWAARWLASLPEGHDLPWHRVLRADGRIAFPPGSSGYVEQSARLRAEDVVVVEGRVKFASRRGGTMDEWVFGGEAQG